MVEVCPYIRDCCLVKMERCINKDARDHEACVHYWAFKNNGKLQICQDEEDEVERRR